VRRGCSAPPDELAGTRRLEVKRYAAHPVAWKVDYLPWVDVWAGAQPGRSVEQCHGFADAPRAGEHDY
jgi:hypothetical protein